MFPSLESTYPVGNRHGIIAKFVTTVQGVFSAKMMIKGTNALGMIFFNFFGICGTFFLIPVMCSNYCFVGRIFIWLENNTCHIQGSLHGSV